MFAEADLLPLSGLQHLVFCERQCALIHVEGQWQENVLTAEGKLLHERVDSGEDETRGDLRIVRGLPLRSLRLGLAGRADVVEFHRNEGEASGYGEPQAGGPGVHLPGLDGGWRLVPVEYKRGEPKYTDCDRVQLCAQALCLEEMLGALIPEGRLFYGRRRRRFDVLFESQLRSRTEETARRFHELVSSGHTPIVYREPKCRSCSLVDVCKPPPRRGRRSAVEYLQNELWREPAEGDLP
jgi:CRISPR-associated exonuclease Cas4